MAMCSSIIHFVGSKRLKGIKKQGLDEEFSPYSQAQSKVQAKIAQSK